MFFVAVGNVLHIWFLLLTPSGLKQLALPVAPDLLDRAQSFRRPLPEHTGVCHSPA